MIKMKKKKKTVKAEKYKLIAFSNIYLFTYCHFYFKDRATDLPFVDSLNACNSQGWARLKPGGRKSFRVMHIGGSDSSTCRFWVYVSRRLDWKQRIQDLIKAL